MYSNHIFTYFQINIHAYVQVDRCSIFRWRYTHTDTDIDTETDHNIRHYFSDAYREKQIWGE